MLLRILLVIIFMAQATFADAQIRKDIIPSQSPELAYVSANAQGPSSSFAYPQNHQSPYFSAIEFNKSLEAGKAAPHPLAKTGKILTFVGLPLMIVGGMMMSNADSYQYHCVNGVCEGDAKGAFGAIFMVSGVGLAGTGIVLWTIGNNKTKAKY